jgi:two-component system, OmpR family, response regulator
MQILVLDDDQEFADGLAALIAQMGHEVSVAYDCASARTRAEAHPFDFILADVELPDGDGRQACEGLRMRGSSSDAFMVAMTGRTDLHDDDFPAFDAYMHKPVTFELLEQVLEEWRIAAGLPKGPNQTKAVMPS